jgi:hypothetical protein
VAHKVLTADYVRGAVLAKLAADAAGSSFDIDAALREGDENLALAYSVRLADLAGALQDTLGVSDSRRAVPAKTPSSSERPGLRLIEGGLSDGA